MNAVLLNLSINVSTERLIKETTKTPRHQGMKRDKKEKLSLNLGPWCLGGELILEETRMKYLCLIHFDDNVIAAMSQAEMTALEEEHLAYDDELRKCGHFIVAEALENAHDSTIVKMRNGKMIVTDGPYAETKEQLGGFFLIEARDLNEAIQVASRIPCARLGSVEVRAVRDLVKRAI